MTSVVIINNSLLTKLPRMEFLMNRPAIDDVMDQGSPTSNLHSDNVKLSAWALQKTKYHIWELLSLTWIYYNSEHNIWVLMTLNKTTIAAAGSMSVVRLW